ncbi:MAG: VWA domain-containing protein [Bacteroidia bacterium]|nr:VWA domain-containing protein [Bacteroidia bacterium]
MKLNILLCCFFAFFVSVSSLKSQTPERKATILDHKDQIRIQKVTTLSSPHRETNLSITPDGQFLFFMSLRGSQPWSRSYMTFRGDSVFDGDIWYSQKINGRWQPPKSMPYGINTGQGEDEPNISADGKTVYFQSWNTDWFRTGGPYYKARCTDGKTWGEREGLGGGITEFFRIMPATDGMTLAPDEKRFVVAAGPDYDANMDIYMSKQSTYGWTYCKKLPISTTGDDRSVFLAADGKTLYFASDGYEGFGGLDIYKTTINSDGTFGEVINVGAPFNTTRDDYGLILTADGSEAYFVRDGDIYFADLQLADERIKPDIPEFVHTLTGTIRDSASWRGLTSEVILLDARTKRVVKKVTTTPAGKYTMELPNKSRVYDQIVVCEGYPNSRRTITTAVKTYNETYPSNFLLSKLPVTTQPEPQVIAQNQTPLPEPPQNHPTEDDPKVPVISKVEVKPRSVEEKPQVVQKPVETVELSDPYSFEGVAENNLILLLDVSASMRKPEKLPLLKDSFKKLLEHMRPEDQISIVVYSGDAEVILDGVSAARQKTISDAIENLRSGGATKGRTALRKAYNIAMDNFIGDGNNRIILATDGYFEVEDLYSTAEKNASNSVYLSVFSFGKLNDEKVKQLQTLAEKGGGNYAGITAENVDLALLKEAKAVRKK